MLLAPAPWCSANIPNCDTRPFIAWPGEYSPESTAVDLVPWELTCQVGKVSDQTAGTLIPQGVVGIVFGILFLMMSLSNQGPGGNPIVTLLGPVAGILALGGGVVVLRTGIRKLRRRTGARVANLTATLPSEAYHFGSPVALHQVRMYWRLVCVCSGFLVCAGAGICLAMWLANQVDDHRVGLIAFLGWPAGLYMIWQGMRLQAKRVLVFADGLVCFDKGKATACRWDQIEEIRMRINEEGDVTRRFQLTLRLEDGEVLYFTPNAEYFQNQLAARIQYEHCTRMLPSMLAKLTASETLDFGPLQVGPAGIDCSQGFFRWDQILTAGMSKTKVQIFGDSGSWEFHAASVPNATLLLALIRRQCQASAAMVDSFASPRR